MFKNIHCVLWCTCDAGFKEREREGERERERERETGERERREEREGGAGGELKIAVFKASSVQCLAMFFLFLSKSNVTSSLLFLPPLVSVKLSLFVSE